MWPLRGWEIRGMVRGWKVQGVAFVAQKIGDQRRDIVVGSLVRTGSGRPRRMGPSR
jgi:hypothetical protein